MGEAEKDDTVEMPAEIAGQVSGERWGRFIRHRKLGGGAGHETWQAWDTERGQWVALRILAGASPAERETAARAGKAAAGISDPRILAPIGAGIHSGQVWIARPYVEGLSLAALPWQDARTLAGIAREVLEALDAARAAGRAHGRVSPGNVLVASREEKGAGWRHAASLSEIGISQGNGAADLRAAGEMFGELLGVRARKAGGSGDTTRAAPVAGGGADPELAEILGRCCKKKTSAAEAARDLAAWLQKKPPAPPARRKLLPLAAAAAAILLAAGSWGAWRWQAGRAFAGDLAAAEKAAKEDRLEDALAHFRNALARRPGDAAVAARLAAVEAALAQKQKREAAAAADAARVASARAALGRASAACEEASRFAARPDASRAELDRLLAPAIEAAEEAIRAAPELPEVWDALAAALDLSTDGPGGTSPWLRLAALRTGSSASWNSPVPARDSLRRWILEAHGPRGRFLPAPENSEAWKRLRLSRVELKVPVRGSQLSPGEVAAAQLQALSLARPGGPETAWFALFRLDAPAAAEAARAALRAGAGPEAASMHAVLGLAEPERAEEHFTEALRIRPWDPLFLFERARAREARGDFKAALADLDRAVALHPNVPDFLLERALARVEAGDLPGAEADAAEAVRRDPRDAAALVVTARLRRERGDAQGTVEAGEAARALEPRMVAAWLIVALCRAETTDIHNLVGWCNSALELDPGRAETLAMRAVARSGGGDPAGAIEDCNAALALDPACWQALARRAQAHARLGKFTEAFADCDEAARLAPGRAQPLFMRGSIRLLKGGDDEGALADGRAAVAINPGSGECWGLVGMALQCLKRPAEALPALDRALEARPIYPQALFSRGLVKRDLGRAADAAADFRAACNLWPDRVEPYIELGEALIATGDTRGAMEAFTAAIDADRGHWRGWLHRARLRHELHDEDGAIEDATRAIGCRSDLVGGYRTRGLAHRAKREFAAAIADYERAAALDPADAAARVMLGDIKYDLNDVEGALAAYSDAIRVDPAFADGWEHRCVARLYTTDPQGALSDAAELRKRGRVAAGWYFEGEAWRRLKSTAQARAAYEKSIAAAGEGESFRVLAEKALAEMGEK